MSTFKLFAGISYTDNGDKQLEFNPGGAHQCGAVIGKLIDDEEKANIFTFTIVREDEETKMNAR